MAELMTGRPQPLAAWELLFWAKFRQYYGFPTDRIEGAIAIGSSVTANVWGNSGVKPADCLPRFGPKRESKKKLIASLAALAGSTVEFVPHGSTVPTLTGADALAKAFEEDGGEWDTPARRTLDGKRPAQRPRTHRTTLDGG